MLFKTLVIAISLFSTSFAYGYNVQHDPEEFRAIVAEKEETQENLAKGAASEAVRGIYRDANISFTSSSKLADFDYQFRIEAKNGDQVLESFLANCLMAKGAGFYACSI